MMPDKPEDPRDMNVLSVQRIGWEKKEQYMHHLAKMASEGYLSDEEWDKRKQWIINAKTEVQVKLALNDLPRVDLRTPAPVKRHWYERPLPVFSLLVFLTSFAAQGAAEGQFVLMVWAIIGSIVLSLTYYRGRKK
jgi:hypothetical protein